MLRTQGLLCNTINCCNDHTIIRHIMLSNLGIDGFQCLTVWTPTSEKVHHYIMSSVQYNTIKVLWSKHDHMRSRKGLAKMKSDAECDEDCNTHRILVGTDSHQTKNNTEMYLNRSRLRKHGLTSSTSSSTSSSSSSSYSQIHKNESSERTTTPSATPYASRMSMMGLDAFKSPSSSSSSPSSNSGIGKTRSSPPEQTGWNQQQPSQSTKSAKSIQKSEEMLYD
eukprot:TRINITY_DN10774_c0_g1_i2.p1 TRINITY_DN10774_c0_g1~~TRINITY_DN10774_c0_g1_i2.p1  ORF type:complete len:223 (+),score=47.80 TRINITY_DN10774_c0_g1_i2:123-791(+)